MFLNTREKNAVCINKEFGFVVKRPQVQQQIEQNPIAWLGPYNLNRVYLPLRFPNFSVPVEDTTDYKIVHLSDIEKGETDILDNSDNEKIRKILKEKKI